VDSPENVRAGILSLHELSHSFGSTQVLRGVNLEFHPGVTAILGVNGAGKSTLLNIAAGITRPRRGRVEINGVSLLEKRKRVLPQVALMPQSSDYPANLSAIEIVEWIAWMRGAKAGASRKSAADALSAVGLGTVANQKFKKLSGGMRRRIALAQALVTNPLILLLDEPSTGLDPAQRRVMVELIRQRSGTVILSSHIMEDVRDLAQRVIVLHDGSVKFDGMVRELERLATERTGREAESGFLQVISS